MGAKGQKGKRSGEVQMQGANPSLLAQENKANVSCTNTASVMQEK